MRIPFVGSSATARSLNADAERSVNCFLEYDQGNPRAPIALYGTPGLVLRATLGTSPVRGVLVCGSYAYWVGGNTVYRMDTAYAVTTLGTIGTASGRVGLAQNGTEVLIVDGATGWIATSTTLTQITDVDFPNGVTKATCQDGYFLVNGDGSGSTYWNETPNTGTAWNGLDFGTAEGSPDASVGILSDHRELWVFGTQSTEIWVNTGDADALFQRSGNTFIEQGTASGDTVTAMNNTVYWLGKGRDGQGIVFRAEGYQPRRISTHALEHAILGYATISDAFAFCFQMAGHSFYALTFPTADATWLYDAATEQWFEWAWRDPADNTLHRHRASCCVFFNGQHLVGDRETGEVYSLDLDTYTDAGDPIKRIRATQTTHAGGKRLFFGQLTVDMETGVGLTSGQGSAPLLMLRYSNDGGHTWSNEKTCSLGAIGAYGARAKFGPSGSAKGGRVWEISLTDPVRFAVFGADVDVEAGT
jgi:hypothetical protein